jgi:hypothetical protein
MPDERVITHAEALRLIEEHMGDKVYLGILVATDPADDAVDPVDVISVIGRLDNPLAPKPPRLEGDKAIYSVGKGGPFPMFHLHPMSGTIHVRDNGVDFRVADTVSIRVAWRGSKEIGDWRPDPESIARLNRRIASASGARTPDRELPKTLHSCPRCGKDHEGITWQTFTLPMKRDGRTISSHWALCPDNGEPIIREVFAEIVSRNLVETHPPSDDDEPQD